MGSEMGLESSIGSNDIGDIESLEKRANEIIGEDFIPQNETWVEQLADFIKDVHMNHKHIKLVGCQFGSLLIAYALGGRIEKVPSLSDQ